MGAHPPTTRSSSLMSSSSFLCRWLERLPSLFCLCSVRRIPPRICSGRERCVDSQSASDSGSSTRTAWRVDARSEGAGEGGV